MFSVETMLVAGILIIFSLFSLYKRLLDISGVVFALAVGLISYLKGGLAAFALLVLIYAIAELTTKVSKSKGNFHDRRDIWNIFGNTVPAIIALLAGNVIGFFGAASSALADTVSSEVGMLSKEKPIMITTLKHAPKGTDGAITFLGLFAGLVAAGFVGLVYYFAIQLSMKMLLLVIFSGVFGTLLDSVLGALLQGRGILDNNQVNFAANCAAGLFAIIVSTLIFM